MRSATVTTVIALALALASAPAVQGCGGAPKHTIQVGAMPADGTFTGVWFSPQYGEMHVEQNGSTAIGRYSKDERAGRMQGTVEGDVMRFEWTETRELIVGRPNQTKGHGYFKIYKDGSEETWNLKGEWGTDDLDHGGGPWTAVKSKSRRPDVAGDGSGSSAPSSSGSSSSSDDDSSSTGGGSDDLGNL